MQFIQSLFCRVALGAVFVLESAIASGAPALAVSRSFSVVQPQIVTRGAKLKQSNPPPPPTNPGSSVPGGRRDPSACPQDAGAVSSPEAGSETGSAADLAMLTALSPTTAPGLTLAEHPTFAVYVPKTSAESAEFSLRDQAGHGLYRTTLALPNTPGIISITLPDQTTPLAIGGQYTWTFAVICNLDDRLDDRFVTAFVQRIALDPTRDRQIAQTPERDRPMLYQQNGLWYDAIALLLALRRSQPHDSNLTTTWRDLLRSGGIDLIIDSSLEES